jgi:hypothetical protein
MMLRVKLPAAACFKIYLQAIGALHHTAEHPQLLTVDQSLRWEGIFKRGNNAAPEA